HLSIAWIIAAALSLSPLLQIVVDKSSWVRMSRICFTLLQIGSIRVRLREIEPLLVAFHSQLKIFHSPLDDNALGKHP
nr:hypothetical protein [Tanacetum cinerariifolium]